MPVSDRPRQGRRPRGTGSLIVLADRLGRETWYAKWRVGGRQVERKLGPKRTPGTADGLTKVQAEAELRRVIAETRAVPGPGPRRTVTDAATELIEWRRDSGRKTSTLGTYESMLARHIDPFFGKRPIDRIERHHVDTFASTIAQKGLSAKSRVNMLNFLHSTFEFALEREWVMRNPVRRAIRPRVYAVNPDIRYLTLEEVEALLRAVPDDDMGRIERPLYLAAAMTGMRMGELLALRWMDVDWEARRVRVRRNYVRGEFGTPKSRRSSRSVPLTDRLAGELERVFAASAFQRDEDLVFTHPHSRKLGTPLDGSKVRKRFKDALERGGIRPVRFHDLRHTFGTRMAGAGVPMRTLQEWMGHRDFTTTLVYADYAPSAHEAEWVEAAFAQDSVSVSTEVAASEI